MSSSQYRERLKTAPAEEQEARRQRAREACVRYRAKNRIQLMVMTRARRIQDFGSKYGLVAFERKMEDKIQCRLRRQETRRRKGRHSTPPTTVTWKRCQHHSESSGEDITPSKKRPRTHVPTKRRCRRDPESALSSFDDEAHHAPTPSVPKKARPSKPTRVAAPDSSDEDEPTRLGTAAPTSTSIHRGAASARTQESSWGNGARQGKPLLGRVRRAPGSPSPRGSRGDSTNSTDSDSKYSESESESAIPFGLNHY
ncbi:hypothetical protein DFH07DRAFT_974075 [Mycena maculata]|uniref:Uncharacterized protein n=1 Tax=Mycena maculata TaxID=230809 RepID=A0AAD7MG81_9AGAR|nr:hypothetical protein DFH07DRAFT_974075 [Mycena maculata]